MKNNTFKFSKKKSNVSSLQEVSTVTQNCLNSILTLNDNICTFLDGYMRNIFLGKNHLYKEKRNVAKDIIDQFEEEKQEIQAFYEDVIDYLTRVQAHNVQSFGFASLKSEGSTIDSTEIAEVESKRIEEVYDCFIDAVYEEEEKINKMAESLDGVWQDDNYDEFKSKIREYAGIGTLYLEFLNDFKSSRKKDVGEEPAN